MLRERSGASVPREAPPRERAVAALAEWGHAAQRLHCVSRSHAEVWRVRATSVSGAAGLDLALRLYPAEPGLEAALDAEVELLRAAAGQGLHVPRPCPTLDGRWRVALDRGRGQAVLLHWLDGRQLWAGLRAVHLRRAGVFIARLHDVAAQQVRCERGPSRVAWMPDLDMLANGPDRMRTWGDARLQQSVMLAATVLQHQMAGWPRDAAHWGWIHGDPHPWNLLFRGGVAGAIDFSDGGWGPLARDLAAVLQFLRDPLDDRVDHRQRLPALRQALFDGYASVRPWPDGWHEQIDALHVLRLLSTLQWMLDDWSTPADRAWGAGFLQRLPQRLSALPAGGA
jgi:Ser/Thr protein kinase RdoA (MazF antagonist)